MRGRRSSIAAACAGALALVFALALVRAEGSDLGPVLFAGCGEVLSGPKCLRAPGRALTFWIETSAPEQVVVEADGRVLAPALTKTSQGVRFVLDALDVKTREVRVHTRDDRVRLILPLSMLEADPDLETAEQLRRDPAKLDEARRAAERAESSGSALRRARAKSLLARIQMRARDYAGARRAFEEAIKTHREVGCISAQYRDLTALGFMLTYRDRDLALAGDALERAAQLPNDDTEQRVLLPYYRALLAIQARRLGSALGFLDLAESGAEKLGMRAQLDDVSIQRREIQLLLGQRAEARRGIEQLRSKNLSELEDCKRAEVMNNIAWQSVLVMDAAHDGVGDPEAALELAKAAEAFYSEGAKCDDPTVDTLALSTVVRAELRVGDLDAAAAALAAARRRQPNVDALERAERLELAARIAERRAQYPEALKLYAELEQLADDAQLTFRLWRALVGEAETLEAMRKNSEALKRYDDADRVFRQLLTFVPLGDGRDSFALRAERVSAQHVALLVRLGKTEKALTVARRDRVRALSLLEIASRVDRMSKDEEKNWLAALNDYQRAREALDAILDEEQGVRDARLKLPADALAKMLAEHPNLAERSRNARRTLKRAFERALSIAGPEHEAPDLRDRAQLGPDDLLLVYHPVPDGWVAFARTQKSTRVEALPQKNDTVSLLAPFRTELDRAKRVIVMPSGALEDVNFHSILVDDTPLGLRVKLSYGIDVDREGTPAKKEADGKLALVVAVDPTGTLSSIDSEARMVSELLSKSGHEVVSLFGSKATRAELSRWLADPRVGWFHFAGHAVSGGGDGLESRLLLADGSLTGTDILTLGHAPAEVVISACEAGKASAGGGVLGLGLAQAFILAGAKKVLASSAPAEDTRTFEMMKALYASSRALDAGEVAKAAFEAGRGEKGSDSFRVVEAW